MQSYSLDDYIKKYIEDYLFADLASMRDYISADLHPGNGAYPMMSALCSSIEFLGDLLREPKTHDGSQHIQSSFAFEHYCKHYLSRVDKRYRVFGIIGRELIRNGIVHSLATKGKIWITRQGEREYTHLVRHTDAGIIVINPDFLHEDFIASYERFVRPILSDKGKMRVCAERNYQRQREVYEKQINKIMSESQGKINELPWHLKEFPYEPRIIEMIEGDGKFSFVS